MIKFTIPIEPRSKKNHGQIVFNHGRAIYLPSKPYQQYEKDCTPFIPRPSFAPISGRINIRAVFYMGTRRKVDLVNLLQAALDIMVKYGLIEDDNSKIVVSVDGSRVEYDKESPRTEIEITEVEEGRDDLLIR